MLSILRRPILILLVALLAGWPASAVLPADNGGASSGAQTASAAVRLEWEHRIMGWGIGARGLFVSDLAADGRTQVIASAERYWYVLEARGGTYEHVWVSEVYEREISSLRVAQVDSDAALEVVVAVGNRILVYDGETRAFQAEFITGAWRIGDLVVADPDSDGSAEFVFCSADTGPSFVVNASSGVEEFRGEAFPCTTVAVGNVDADSSREIVLGQGTNPGWVIDGATHAVEWANAYGFGDMVRLGDLDGDGKDEIVAGFESEDIQIFEGDLHLLSGSIHLGLYLGALRVADIDGNGRLEIAYEDTLWGSIHILDGRSRQPLWTLSTPDGVNDLAFGDTDSDGVVEMLWGSGFATTGADYLRVASTVTRSEEWRSEDVAGPFLSLAHGDVDGDGAPELVYGSYSSESGYGDGRYFVHDASTHAREYASRNSTGSNWVGLRRLQSANVDSDPQEEVFLATGDYYDGVIMCFDGLTHVEQWRYKVASHDSLFASLEVGDVDLDGQLEVVAGTFGGDPWMFVYVLDGATGALEWRSPNLGPTMTFRRLPLLRIANVDADVQPEIVAGNYEGVVFVVDRVLEQVQDLGDRAVTALDTPDRNHDGIAEIVIGTKSGKIQVLTPTGAVAETLASLPGQIDGLRVVDVDGNGSLESVFCVQNELFLYSSAGHLRWRSGLIESLRGSTPGSGKEDALLVADIDRDGLTEIMVGSNLGVRVFEVGELGTARVSIADASVAEGSGTAFAEFAVSLDGPYDEPVEVEYSTRSASALSGVDFLPVSGRLVIPAGATSARISVPIVGDSDIEADETFVVLLNAPTTATIVDAEATGTILNDDLPGLRIGDALVKEPESGTTTAVFSVSLSPAYASAVGVDYSTEDGSATAPNDFTTTTGHLDFAPGETSRTIAVPVLADDALEPTERFTVRLTGATGAPIIRGTGTGTIGDLDASGLFTLTPCRLVDTRGADGPALGASEQRTFSLAGLCGIPSSARSLVLNVTVVEASAGGHVTLFADGAPRPNASVVNFPRSSPRAGNAVVPLSPAQAMAAQAVLPSGSAHLILDVTGYFE